MPHALGSGTRTTPTFAGPGAGIQIRPKYHTSKYFSVNYQAKKLLNKLSPYLDKFTHSLDVHSNTWLCREKWLQVSCLYPLASLLSVLIPGSCPLHNGPGTYMGDDPACVYKLHPSPSQTATCSHPFVGQGVTLGQKTQDRISHSH